MFFDRPADGIRRSLRDGDQAAGVRQRIEDRVQSADVVKQEKGDCPEAVAPRLEFLQERGEVVDRGLALARRSGRKQHQAWMLPCSKLSDVRMIGGRPGLRGNAEAIFAIKGDPNLG